MRVWHCCDFNALNLNWVFAGEYVVAEKLVAEDEEKGLAGGPLSSGSLHSMGTHDSSSSLDWALDNAAPAKVHPMILSIAFHQRAAKLLPSIDLLQQHRMHRVAEDCRQRFPHGQLPRNLKRMGWASNFSVQSTDRGGCARAQDAAAAEAAAAEHGKAAAERQRQGLDWREASTSQGLDARACQPLPQVRTPATACCPQQTPHSQVANHSIMTALKQAEALVRLCMILSWWLALWRSTVCSTGRVWTMGVDVETVLCWHLCAGAERVGFADIERQVGPSAAGAGQRGCADPVAHVRLPGGAIHRAERAAHGVGRRQAVALARLHPAQGRPPRDLQVLLRLGVPRAHQLQMIAEAPSWGCTHACMCMNQQPVLTSSRSLLRLILGLYPCLRGLADDTVLLLLLLLSLGRSWAPRPAAGSGERALRGSGLRRESSGRTAFCRLRLEQYRCMHPQSLITRQRAAESHLLGLSAP